MDFIKKHKTPLIIITICLILLIVAGVTLYKLMFPSSAEDINGDRLTNQVEVDQAVIEQILGELNASDLVDNATYNKNVRILKFFIKTTKGTELNKAKELTSVITDKLSEDVMGYYDIEVFLTQDENETYPAIGYKFKTNDYFSWNNDGVDNNE